MRLLRAAPTSPPPIPSLRQSVSHPPLLFSSLPPSCRTCFRAVPSFPPSLILSSSPPSPPPCSSSACFLSFFFPSKFVSTSVQSQSVRDYETKMETEGGRKEKSAAYSGRRSVGESVSYSVQFVGGRSLAPSAATRRRRRRRHVL